MRHVHHPASRASASGRIARGLTAVAFASAMLVAPIAPALAEASPATTASTTAAAVVDAALEQVGTPYLWGGASPSGFDCSGLTSFVYEEAGVTIPRTSRAQYSHLNKVKRSDLRAGDLVFFHSPVSHVAIYIGDGQIVESPNSGNRVRVRDLSERSPVGFARP